MTTVFEECTTEKQGSILRFCGQKDSMQSILIKKCSLVTLGSVCRVKRFATGLKNVAKLFVYDEEVEKEVQIWLRQQSEHFYAAGFDAPVKRWDKCINVGGGYVEK
jgi:hypothetical protein